jgi:Na+/melibiose symporter-like transporter
MIAHVSLNFAYNAQLGLISVVAKSVKERMRMSTRNVQYGMASQIIYSYFVLDMLYRLRKKSETWGYFNSVAILAVIVVSVLGAGVSVPTRQAMYMDSAEYGFYTTGKDASAFIMSMFTLPIKTAIAIAGTIVTAGLEFIGYVPNITPSRQFISTLMDLICYIPAGVGLLAFGIIIFYSLSDDKLAEIMEANAKRRLTEASMDKGIHFFYNFGNIGIFNLNNQWVILA